MFGGALGLFGALLLTNESLIQRVKQEPPNALSIAYLEAWLRISKDDTELPPLLASQYIRVGRIDEANSLINSLLRTDDPTQKQAIVQLRMDLLEQKLWALQADDPERTNVQSELVALLMSSESYTWPAPDLKVFAIRAHALGLPTLSEKFFSRLAKVDPANKAGWRELFANWALADGRYMDAADEAFLNQKSAPTFALQREYFLRGMSILESGNLLGLAMKDIDKHLTPILQRDPQTLRVLIRMAGSANRPDLASEYAERLLSLPLQRSSVDRLPSERYQKQAAWRINDYEYQEPRDWVYLDGVKGNALRQKIDLASGQSTRLTHVSLQVNKPAQSTQAAKAENKKSPETGLKEYPVRSDVAADDDYALAYQAFLADQKLEPALDVVGRALKRNPSDPVWMKRNAMLNEWLGHPAPALQAWLKLARQTQSDEAWRAVERLSVALYDDVSYIEALRHRANGSAEELLSVDQIVATYERLGEPEKALGFLRTQIKNSTHKRELLERYAALAERFGEDDLALQTWQQLNQRFGPKSNYAVRIANLYSSKGQFDLALKVVIDAKDQAGAADYVYWRVLKNIAIRVGDYKNARLAARHLIEDKEQDGDELTEMIALWNPYPIDAGRIAERAFHNSGSIQALEQAVYQYSRARAWPRIDHLLADLTPEQEKQASMSPEFMLAKAEYERQTGKHEESLATLRATVALGGGVRDAVPAYVWTLVDSGSDDELRSALQRWRPDAEENEQLWAPFAAGYMRLSQEANSLYFFNKSLPSKRQDPLWRLTFAEALETFGYVDRAWDIRRQVWYNISEQRRTLFPSQTVAARDNQDQESLQEADEGPVELRATAAALSQPYAGGDFSRELLLKILREERMAAQNATKDASGKNAVANQLIKADTSGMSDTSTVKPVLVDRAVTEDVALAWALSNDPYELASQWMTKRYGDELRRPAYAEVAVALAKDDRAELDRLLTSNPDRIPVLSRIEANMRLDRWSEAQHLAFEGADGSPHSEELQSTVRDMGIKNAHFIEAGVRQFRQAPLDFTESDVGLGLRLSDRWTLTVKEILRRQKSTSSASLVNVPRSDRTLVAGLSWEDSDTRMSVEAGSRRAVENITPVRVEASWNQQSSLNWTASAGYNQEAEDSAALRIGGLKDEASVGAQWRVGERETLSANVGTTRYYDQNRFAVGKGNQIDLDAAYNIRLEYPDFTVRGIYTRARYHTTATDAGPVFTNLLPIDDETTAADVMPTSFTQKGVLFSFGTALQTSYTRDWRPFMEFGYLNDSRLGWGTTGSIGLAGTVFGNDHAVIYYSRDRTAKGLDGGEPATEIGVRYRWYF
ncbi:MAG TPA: tetratricopeptide repeat protein [Oxalicibacterium sp.]|uniref:tetratricopeptide repeat protein n=1 Tax=Oxalicibacterium sp. TaxID=2766525 RepID=UPI002BAF6F6E|nr:tetratricopeptide repeat protein [Oxalicibacterium sp.]HWU97782.1 tetratricopeptide repeat protein [Oxalicibacterium sp.]